MLLCDCAACGRRELRGVRSLVPIAGTFGVACRHCGTLVPAGGTTRLTRLTRPAPNPYQAA